MRLRALAVTTALVLAATGLSACTSKVGDAAVVGGHAITTKDVDRYVNPAGPTAAGLAQEQGQPVSPRVLVLETMIQRDLFLGALAKTPGGVPSAEKLRAEHDAVASQISQGQAAGAAFDKAFNAQLTSLGFQASFAAVYVQTQELAAVLTTEVKATTLPEIVAAIAKAQLHVSVSSRYGSWDSKNLDLSTTAAAGRPPFVSIGTDIAVAPSASSGQ